jgi:hypothetical protein
MTTVGCSAAVKTWCHALSPLVPQSPSALRTRALACPAARQHFSTDIPLNVSSVGFAAAVKTWCHALSPLVPRSPSALRTRALACPAARQHFSTDIPLNISMTYRRMLGRRQDMVPCPFPASLDCPTRIAHATIRGSSYMPMRIHTWNAQRCDARGVCPAMLVPETLSQRCLMPEALSQRCLIPEALSQRCLIPRLFPAMPDALPSDA